MKVIVDSHYAPSISWWKTVAQSTETLIEESTFFRKGSFRNRCIIYGANGNLRLSIPLQKGKDQRSIFREVQISYEHPWQKIHWESICAAYRSSPYFEYYEQDIQSLFNEKIPFLSDFNRNINETLKSFIGIKGEWKYTELYSQSYQEEWRDLRELIHPDPNKNLIQKEFTFNTYQQVFSNKYGFLPDLSIFDLLFNLGPSTFDYLMD